MDVTRFKFLTQNLTTIFINGNLTLASDAITGTDLATKHNVDIGFNDRVLKAGDNLVGEILQTVDGYRPYDSVRKTQADALANSSSSITENQIDQLSTNKALRASPAFTGPLELDYNSYTQTSLVSKNFIDNLNKDISGVPGSITPGTVIELPTTITPSGYLRLNGASVSKTTYPALYSAIGDNYAPNISGYGNPHYQQYDINNAINSTNLGSIFMDKNSPDELLETNRLPISLANHHVFTNRNYVYSVGGDTFVDANANVIINTVYRAQIDSSGKILPWTTYGSYPIKIAGGSCVYTKDYVYILGGANYYTDESHVTGVVSCYRASLNSNGSIGSWSAVSSLPVAIGYTSACIIGNYIYLFGGRTDLTSSASRTQIYRTVINSDGSLGAWTLYGNLPVGFDSGRVAVIGNRVYVMGGRSTLSYSTSPFLYANINSDYSLGSWTSLGNFVKAMTHFAIAVTNQKLYVFGTVNETYFYSTSYWANKVYVANITSDPNLTFTEGPSIPAYLGISVWLNFESLVTSSRVYLIGGKHASTTGSYGNVSDVRYFNFNGGSNDYITLLQNTSVTDPNSFYLPDYTYKETQNPNMKYYIKT